MKVKRVSAAVIRRGDEILATLRSHGEYRGYWGISGRQTGGRRDAPAGGGARKSGKNSSADVALGELISQIEYDYPDFHLTMYCYFAEILSGSDAQRARRGQMAEKEDLDSVRWLPADFDVIQRLKELL